MRFATLLSVPTVLAVAATTAGATTWHVPGDASSIQAGINLASANDTVLVACGTYHEHDVVLKNGVVLRSETGLPECVRVEADFLGRVLTAAWDYSHLDTSFVRGFTFVEGLDEEVAGIYFSHHGLVVVENCRVVDNMGRGVSCLSAYDDRQPSTDLLNCQISRNTGAGIYYETPYRFHKIIDCEVSDNGGDGIGIFAMGEFYDLRIARCNIARNAGAGISILDANHNTIDTCLIVGNDGPGVSLWTVYSASFRNCTIAGNGAQGLTLESGVSAGLSRCLVAFNSGSGVACWDEWDSADLACCDVYGNAGGDYDDDGGPPCIEDQLGVNGNIWADPLFCDATGGDFRVDCSSPCLSASGCGQIGALGAGCNTTEVVGGADIPRSYALSANWPNPFNPNTSIRFTVPERAVVDLTLYDTAGRRVALLASGVCEAGEHVISWNGLDDAGHEVASGTYFARLHAGEYVAVRKMVLIRR